MKELNSSRKHEQVRDKILKQTKRYKKQEDKHRKKVMFKERDLVWIHLIKERFPNIRFPNVERSRKSVAIGCGECT